MLVVEMIFLEFLFWKSLIFFYLAVFVVCN